MLHPLLPIDLRRRSKAQLKAIIEACEAALLDGTYTSSHMATLIESEKEMLRREHIEVKRTIAEAQRTHYDLHPADLPKPARQPLPLNPFLDADDKQDGSKLEGKDLEPAQ